MGIRKKIFLGFLLIGITLLLSSIISIFEFVRMRQNISSLVSDNITSLNTSYSLIEITDKYNFAMLESMEAYNQTSLPDITEDTRFSSFLSETTESFLNENEKNMADSVLYAYTAYIHIIHEMPLVWQGEYQERREWYFNRLYPVYRQLRGYLQKLNSLSYDALYANSRHLGETFYRSIMPSVVAVAIGIILVFLFNYFVNKYFITPILLITKGISNFIQYNKRYAVNIDSDDELMTLNENVAELTELNRRESSDGFGIK